MGGCCGSDSTNVATSSAANQMMQKMPPVEIEYFDANGRALALRMLAWYCSVPHTNARRTFPEFKEKKVKGSYKLGSMPVINFKDGSQMAET